MDIDPSSLKLVIRGSNSEIYRYGPPQAALILKLVPSAYKKEARHLANEFNILSKLNHENIIKVLRYKQNVLLKSSPSSDSTGKSKDILVL